MRRERLVPSTHPPPHNNKNKALALGGSGKAPTRATRQRSKGRPTSGGRVLRVVSLLRATKKTAREEVPERSALEVRSQLVFWSDKKCQASRQCLTELHCPACRPRYEPDRVVDGQGSFKGSCLLFE